jgi:phage baseplate assembly protein W
VSAVDGTDLIGVGWAFPAGITPTGAVRLVGGAEELEGAIQLILSTAPGERLMRPDFGCAMWEQVFAPLTPATLGAVEQAAREALERWEPRIVLDRVEAVPDPEAASIHVHITYMVISTNDRRNLVYPFYVIPRDTPRTEALP